MLDHQVFGLAHGVKRKAPKCGAQDNPFEVQEENIFLAVNKIIILIVFISSLLLPFLIYLFLSVL